MRRLTTMTIALGALLLPGCDASDDDARVPADSIGVMASDQPAGGGGCALVTEDELERAVGFDVVMNDNSGGNCLATPADGSASAPTVDFRIEPRTAAFDYYSAQADATPVEGLGERAVWATVNETTGTLVAVSGARSVVVGIGKADGVSEQSRVQAEAVARLILD